MSLIRSVLYFVTTLLIYLGVPLVGWGLDDLAGYFALPPRAAYALVVAAFGLAIGWQAFGHPEGIRGQTGEGAVRSQRQHWVRIGAIIAVYAALYLLPFFDRRGVGVWAGGTGLRWLGDVLCLAGYAFIFWSGLALGAMYSQEVMVQKEHVLVTGGPYARIRHPRYLGVMLLIFGLSLLFCSWVGLLASLLSIGVLAVRIRDEERLLAARFGEDWVNYCRRTWKMIPGVY